LGNKAARGGKPRSAGWKEGENKPKVGGESPAKGRRKELAGAAAFENPSGFKNTIATGTSEEADLAGRSGVGTGKEGYLGVEKWRYRAEGEET